MFNSKLLFIQYLFLHPKISSLLPSLILKCLDMNNVGWFYLNVHHQTPTHAYGFPPMQAVVSELTLSGSWALERGKYTQPFWVEELFMQFYFLGWFAHCTLHTLIAPQIQFKTISLCLCTYSDLRRVDKKWKEREREERVKERDSSWTIYIRLLDTLNRKRF